MIYLTGDQKKYALELHWYITSKKEKKFTLKNNFVRLFNIKYPSIEVSHQQLLNVVKHFKVRTFLFTGTKF